MRRTHGERGGAEVHTHLGVGPPEESAGEPRERYDDTPFGMDDVNVRGERTDGVRDRAEELLGRARERAAALGPGGGLLDRVRDNPLPALGIALGLGFLLAGRTDPDSRFGRVKQRFRGTLVTGLLAAVAEEAREIFGEEVPVEQFEEKPRRRRPPAKTAKRRRPRRPRDED